MFVLSLQSVIQLLLLLPGAAPGPECPAIIILGSTGDLVRRYIWEAIWGTFTVETPVNIVATTREDKTGLLDSLNDELKCSSKEDCPREKMAMWKKCTASYLLKNEKDYQKLNDFLETASARCGCVESQRLFYLAVPPSAYASISHHIHQYTRPQGGGVPLKVVLEKPFGGTLSEALHLVHQLQASLQEEEIFRVDHYLGKMAVQSILNFRCSQTKLNEYFSSDQIARIDVTAAESLTVALRTGYFDQYGTIRDMLQNHLTQLLLMATISLPQNCLDTQEIEASKLVLLKSVSTAVHRRALIGQYAGYRDHVIADGGGRGSRTVTFATAVLTSSSSQWAGTKFVLTSGKALSHKSTHVRIAFKVDQDGCYREIIFIIHEDGGLDPGVVFSERISDLIDYKQSDVHQIDGSDYQILRDGCGYIYLPCHSCGLDAYSNVIQSALEGDTSVFVSSAVLLESWRVWTGLVEEIDSSKEQPIIYDTSNLSTLAFTPWHEL